MPGQMPATPGDGDGRDDASRGAGTDGSTPVGASGAGQRSTATILRRLVPAATFVAGLVLGALISGTGPGQDDELAGPPDGRAPAATPAVTPSPRAGGTVTVPASCLEIADRADELTGLIRDAAVAAAELDAARLSGIVRQMEEAQAPMDELSDDCRTGADVVP